ncbi:GNAT family N-acetyltransferase [Venatoribacter cucullus]|uniref:GNAT family N-acetyltransferase n=1 Tax=Venatoribacter cucullus TaxID=2661630 RepID=UPI001E3EA43D|nr:GNAT family N-acetyltransferase [Venatoribacter cucullus]
MQIELANWTVHKDALRAVRRRVFIDEQGVPEALEWDSDDASAVHFLARDGKRPAGCLRLLSNGTLGRMAVMPEYRGQHIGSQLLRSAEQHYLNEMRGRSLRANVQTQAYYFYWQNGYSPEPDFNVDAGITHIRMSKVLGRTLSPSEQFIPGKDSQRYVLNSPCAANGLLQIATQFSVAGLAVHCADLQLPVWRDRDTYTRLTAWLRASRRRTMQILIPSEYAGIADHPLLQWQQRLSSRVQIQVHSSVNQNLIVLKPHGYIDIQRDQTIACFTDRARAAKELELFKELLRSSQMLREGRRLRL